MLTDERIEHILTRLPSLTIGVLGDLFLDRYLDIDAALTEKSIETGLDAYQVVRVRSLPGALGTVMNNLVALGVGRICPISIIGDDGEGHELRQALAQQQAIETKWLFSSPQRRTPTYTKPMMHEAGQPPRELNRLDIKNRTPTPEPLEDLVLEALHAVWPQVDALIVLDQVSEENCGVVTTRVREKLATIGEKRDDVKLILADSRERIGLFRGVCLKPNRKECLHLWGQLDNPTFPTEGAVKLLARSTGRAVFCTDSEQGIVLADGTLHREPVRIPGYPITGPIDPVGAGDSTSAGITCAVAAGASLEEAAAFGCLIASITIQQIGTTGTASPEQVRQRWREVREATR